MTSRVRCEDVRDLIVVKVRCEDVRDLFIVPIGSGDVGSHNVYYMFNV